MKPFSVVSKSPFYFSIFLLILMGSITTCDQIGIFSTSDVSNSPDIPDEVMPTELIDVKFKSLADFTADYIDSDFLRRELNQMTKAIGLDNLPLELRESTIDGVAKVVPYGRDRRVMLIKYDKTSLLNAFRLNNNSWTIRGILAHELGHYLNNRRVIKKKLYQKSDEFSEFEADVFAGYLLRMANASYNDATAFLVIADEEAKGEYGTKEARLKFVQYGWLKAHLNLNKLVDIPIEDYQEKIIEFIELNSEISKLIPVEQTTKSNKDLLQNIISIEIDTIKLINLEELVALGSY